MLTVRYKPAYAVTFKDEVIGYVENKDEFQEVINNDILTTDKENVAFVALDNVDYSFQFVSRNLFNEDEILSELKENSKNIYEVYEVVEGENEETAVFFNSEGDANEYVDTLKEEYKDIEVDLKISTLYIEDEVNEETVKEARQRYKKNLMRKLERKRSKKE